MTKRKHAADAHEEGHENSERWLLTYSDMITLLLALFIVLFAASTISAKKFLALAMGFRQTFNPSPGILPSSNGLLQNASLTATAGAKQAPEIAIKPMPTTTTTTTTPPPTPSNTATNSAGSKGQQSLATIAAQINQALTAKGLQQAATTTVTQQGLVVQVLTDHVFFASDVASLNSTGNAVVDTIASVLRTDTNVVDVEGFTDNQPIIGGPYATNTELSAERAVNVVVRLYKVDGVAQSRLAAVGYGSAHPAVPNTSPANMAKNRRIDIVILGPGHLQP